MYNNSNNDGERRPRPRFHREGAEPVGRPRFSRDGEARPRFSRDGESRPSRPYGERSERPNRPFGGKPKRNPGVYSGHKQQVYREQHEDPTKPIRLNKYLANAGICSRREADDFIQAGVITVNGETVDNLGAKVLPTDDVRFHDQPVRRERKVYILLNKPKNTVTTTDDPQERHTVIDIVRSACAERIYPVGRLDRNTTGVLLLTNDGDLAAKLTHPKFQKKKIWIANWTKWMKLSFVPVSYWMTSVSFLMHWSSQKRTASILVWRFIPARTASFAVYSRKWGIRSLIWTASLLQA